MAVREKERPLERFAKKTPIYYHGNCASARSDIFVRINESASCKKWMNQRELMVIHFAKLRRAPNHRDRGLTTQSFNFFPILSNNLIDPHYSRKFKWI